MKAIALALAGTAVLLGGCATTATGPAQATRFHTGEPIARGTVAIVPATGAEPSLEFRTIADAVARDLAANGYRVVPNAGSAQFVADVAFARTAVEPRRQRSPVSVGLGGGTFSGGRRGGFGLGGGVGFPIGGGGRSAGVIASEMSVRIRQRAGDTVIWEGRAQSEARGNTPAAQPVAAADELSRALFAGFPGRSGETITLR